MFTNFASKVQSPKDVVTYCFGGNAKYFLRRIPAEQLFGENFQLKPMDSVSA